MLSEKEKTFFRELLDKERRKILDASQRTLEEDVKVEREADEVDQASNSLNQNLTFRLRDRDRKLLAKINEAIESIEDGTYGECEECGCEISLKRLQARPESRFCVECKEQRERNQKSFADKSMR